METKRLVIPAAEALLDRYFPVLDHGFIALKDYMGGDEAIDEAARTSYGAGTRKVSERRGLIRTLRRNLHTSPFEMCELKFHCSMPIFVARQWIRHRTACLAGDVLLHFDLPGGIERRGNQLNKLSVKHVYDAFREDSRISKMHLRCLNEEMQTVEHTNIVDIWESGVKPVYQVELEDGSSAAMSQDHRCLTASGWAPLKKVVKLPTKDDPSWECQYDFLSIGPGRDTGVITQFNDIDEATENWAPIYGWEERYEVSDQGRVRRIVGGKGSRSFGRCKKLTPMPRRAVVSLNRPGKQVVEQVHELVLTAFVGPKPEGTEGCHNDGNGLNNQLANLRWDTPASNARDRVRDGATTKLRGNLSKVVSVTYLGEEMTYDLEVAGPWHNFSAGGMVVHNSVNEYSARYSVMPMLFYVPDQSVVGVQSINNRQGRGQPLDAAAFETYLESLELTYERARLEYEKQVSMGVARETARGILPLNGYTQWYWKIDLHNLLHFLGLRCDPHAQLEIRVFADVMAGMVKMIAPLSFEAWIDYFFAGARMSRMEMGILRELLTITTNKQGEGPHLSASGGFFDGDLASFGLSKTEVTEFLAKLRKKDVPSFDFDLDLSLAKDGAFFLQQWEDAVPKIDKATP